MTSVSIPFHVPTKLKVAYLCLDSGNPRYTAEQEMAEAGDVELIRQLSKRADLAELVQSISSNGYIDIEPLIVMPEDDAFVVLEGNRRLAAIRLLTNLELAQECGVAVPTVTAEVAATLEEVTVYSVEKREDARNFIGFKHINGPHRWDALAKARFAADWYRNERTQGVTLRDIANRLGDRHDTVKRLVYGIFVLDEAREARIFDVVDRYPGRPFAFSHLYTSLTRPGFQEFLGLPGDWRKVDPEPNPVPKDKLDNLRQVLIWLYGSKEDSIAPVITSQNPHVRMLGEILQKPMARKTMLARNDLTAAYALVYTPTVQFETALLNAHQNAEEALSKVSAFDGEDMALVEAADQLHKTVRIIHTTMVTFVKEQASDTGPSSED